MKIAYYLKESFLLKKKKEKKISRTQNRFIYHRASQNAKFDTLWYTNFSTDFQTILKCGFFFFCTFEHYISRWTQNPNIFNFNYFLPNPKENMDWDSLTLPRSLSLRSWTPLSSMRKHSTLATEGSWIINLIIMLKIYLHKLVWIQCC